MILINVALTCKPGFETRFRQLLRDTMTASAGEPGCVDYRFTADLDSPDTYHLVELWRDEAALLGHLKGPIFTHFLATLPSLGALLSSVAYQGALSSYQVPR
jgi:quinol monooxygenase YgiN